jgi:glycosyltransferase involved in cell wall biosynthesis
MDATKTLKERSLGAQKIGDSNVAVDPVDASGGGAISLSVIMPTVSWTGCFEPCVRAVLEHSAALGGGGAEIVVVFDGVGSPPPRWLTDAGVKVFTTGDRRGPAHARNLGAAEASGNVMLFLDADVEIAPDALERIRTAFTATPDLVALFGSYDDSPACTGVVSQFRNLLHHHTHTSHPGRAASFWSGCGAIRSAAFFDVGGFDDDFHHPSVEDIELGLRVQAAGGRIVLDPAIQCKHHKSWSLRSMVMTDIFRRAVPWTQLILENRDLPVTLNLDWGNRLCGAAALFSAGLLPLSIVIGSWWPLLAGPVVLLAMAWMHLDFYQLCLRRRGIAFAFAAFALHWLFYLYSTLTFAAVVVGSKASLFLGRLPWRRLSPESTTPSNLGTR